MPRKSAWNYYGVKIIKQILVEGEPDPAKLDDEYEEATLQSFEESVMLVHAQSFDHAYRLAEKISTRYDQPYENPYGQTVTWKFVEAVDCFELFDQPCHGVEAYSCFHETRIGVTPEEFLDKWFQLFADGNGFDKSK